MKVSTASITLWLTLSAAATTTVQGFQQPGGRFAATAAFSRASAIQQTVPFTAVTTTTTTALFAESSDEKKENPYQDPNYPDIEFVNYDDPEYQVDQGTGEEFFNADSTEEAIEEMREERRMRNDEFQFETYYRDVLREGAEYKGEWTHFQTSTFMPEFEDDITGFPRLARAGEAIKVITKGERIMLQDLPEGTSDLDASRLLHIEKLSPESIKNIDAELLKKQQEIVAATYWPEQTSAFDFRGHQGIMCVGNAYTICRGIPLNDKKKEGTHDGPFSQYFAEVAIQEGLLRFRIKLNYAVTAQEQDQEYPKLRLRSFTICRETKDMWPRAEGYTSAAAQLTEDILFGAAGAPGGLYDPPPVGSDEQASQYMKLDLEGGATTLFPYVMDQDPEAHDGRGWVTSLDWTPGKTRFQVDRKVHGGAGILGLRTLELSEVESSEAAKWRPRDGGEDMRQ